MRPARERPETTVAQFMTHRTTVVHETSADDPRGLPCQPDQRGRRQRRRGESREKLAPLHGALSG
jgi:hypothetical protein